MSSADDVDAIGVLGGLGLLAFGWLLTKSAIAPEARAHPFVPVDLSGIRGRAQAQVIANPSKASPMTTTPPISNPYPPNLAPWLAIVTRLIAAEFPRIDPRFAMKWIDLESGGNPCAVGDPGQLGQGSQEPAEIGLGQLYNPDDFKRYGVDPARFRAYCPAAAPLAQQYSAARAAHDKTTMASIARQMQTMTRALSQDEMDDQVRYTVLHKADDGVTNANHIVATYGLHWTQPDFWKLVKAPHAYPPILNQGMPAVVKKLGRAPTSWLEFRNALGMDMTGAQAKCEAGDANACTHWSWMRALDNAQAAGDATAASQGAIV